MTVRKSLSGPPTAAIVGLVVGALGDLDPVGDGTGVPVLPTAGDRHPAGRRVVRRTDLVAVDARRGSVPGVVRDRGFLIEGIVGGTGFDNLAGDAGMGRALGQGIQVVGVVTAVVAG